MEPLLKSLDSDKSNCARYYGGSFLSMPYKIHETSNWHIDIKMPMKAPATVNDFDIEIVTQLAKAYVDNYS